MITTRSNWHLTQIPPFQPITLVLSPQSADIKKVEKVSIMTRIHFPIAMPFCQSEFKVGPHFNQKLVCSSVLQRLYLICWKYARLQAAERFTAFCRDYQELFFFLLKRSQPDLPHFRLGGTLCVFFFFFGGGEVYNGAKSTLRQIITTITITLTIFILLDEGTRYKGGCWKRAPNAKSLQTLIKLLHRRFRSSTAEKTLVRLFHFLMLSIRPNVLVSKLLLLTFYLEIYFRPLFSQENLKLKHYSDDDALVLLWCYKKF